MVSTRNNTNKWRKYDKKALKINCRMKRIDVGMKR